MRFAATLGSVALMFTWAVILAGPATATEYFSADFEAGDLSEWGNVQALPGRAAAVKSPVAQGTYAGRFEVQEGDEEPDTGDQRAEVISGEEFEASDVRFFRILSRVNSWDYDNWGLIWQIHDDSVGTPPLSLQLYDDGPIPMLWLGPGSGLEEYWEAPLPSMNQWFEIVIRVEFGPKGSVQVWLNGEPQVMLNEALIFDEVDTLGEPPGYDKLGIYRSQFSKETAVVYHDDYRITDEFFSDPPGTRLTSSGGSTPTVQAKSEGHITLHNPVAKISCSSEIHGSAEGHGEGQPAQINLTGLLFSSCTNSWHVTVEAKGSLQVNGSINNDGTVAWSGATLVATRFGITCRYITNSTHMGTLTDGEHGTLHLQAALPFHSGSGLCGAGTTAWTGSYKLDSPTNLKID